MQRSNKKIIQITLNNEYEKKKRLLKCNFSKSLKQNSEIKFDKKTSNLFREQKKDKLPTINVRAFNKVLSIDQENKTAEIEAMISFADLVDVTLKYNLLPPVVPQLKTITVGGAISGIGIEASSFKYGLVHETILEMEVMLGDGRIIICTPKNQYRDLFFALPNSYGTLGYILKIKMRLIPAKQFIELRHHKYQDDKIFFQDLKKMANEKKQDYLDGTIFNEREMYITRAKFVDKAAFVSNYKYMNIYFKSIKKNKKDYLSTKDFIWRWDTDWFWCSKVFGMQNPFLRLLFGKFMLGSKSYWTIARFNEKYKIQKRVNKILNKNDKTESIVQDIVVPIEKCSDFLAFFNKLIRIKPIWICPTKVYNKKYKYPLFKMDANKLYVDFGFWDVIKTDKSKGYYNKKIEAMVEKLNGKKSLYSTSFYTKEKFWQIHNKKNYQKLKNKYDKNNRFKDLYEQCAVNK